MPPHVEDRVTLSIYCNALKVGQNVHLQTLLECDKFSKQGSLRNILKQRVIYLNKNVQPFRLGVREIILAPCIADMGCLWKSHDNCPITLGL